jgi:hypothetical protein
MSKMCSSSSSCMLTVWEGEVWAQIWYPILAQEIGGCLTSVFLNNECNDKWLLFKVNIWDLSKLCVYKNCILSWHIINTMKMFDAIILKFNS